jgi:hypothetical protein
MYFALVLLGAIAASVFIWIALGLHMSDFSPRKKGRFGLHRRLFFIATTALLVGVLLLFMAPWVRQVPEAQDMVRDVGRAFLAAAIIGIIIELAEVRDFFVSILNHVITSDEFRRQLSDAALDNHSEAAITEHVKRTVNNPDHQGELLVRSVLGATTPPLCDTYRESYDERVDFCIFKSSADVEACWKRIGKKHAPLPPLAAPVYLLECRRSFYLIPPVVEGTEYEGEILIDARLIDGWDPRDHARCTVKIGDAEEREVPLTAKSGGPLHLFTGRYSTRLNATKTRVEVRTWEFNANQRTGFAIEMVTMTKGITVVFASDLDLYPEIAVYSLNGGSSGPTQAADRRIASFSRSDLILLAGHGYCISWSLPAELRPATNSRPLDEGDIEPRAAGQDTPPALPPPSEPAPLPVQEPKPN